MAPNLFFYRNDGVNAVCHIDSGKLVQTASADTATHNWTQIVAVGDNLFFYRNDGVNAVCHIDSGKLVQTASALTATHDWTKIVAVG